MTQDNVWSELDRFNKWGARPTGSRYICNPPVMDTDVDIVMRVPTHEIKEFENYVDILGYVRTSDETNYPNSEFKTHRKGMYNLIVYYDSLEQYNKFVTATEIAKKFNLTNKEDRILLFEAILGKINNLSMFQPVTINVHDLEYTYDNTSNNPRHSRAPRTQ